MKSKKSQDAVAEIVNTVVTETVTTESSIENTNTVKTPGRPVDMNSNRQKRLIEYEMKRMLGKEPKRGRPANPESERQKKLANKTPGAKPGRPKMSDEERELNEKLRKQHIAEEKERIATAARTKMIEAGLWDFERNAVKEGVTPEQIKSALTTMVADVEAE